MPAKSPFSGVGIVSAVARQRGFPDPIPEYRFLPDRKFRFDLAWPALKVAYEREGGTWGKSRHTSGVGYRNDCEKYSLAAIAGWCVVRATADMIRDGSGLTLLLQALSSRSPSHDRDGT